MDTIFQELREMAEGRQFFIGRPMRLGTNFEAPPRASVVQAGRATGDRPAGKNHVKIPLSALWESPELLKNLNDDPVGIMTLSH